MTFSFFGLSLLPPAARRPRAIAALCRRVLKNEKSRVRGEVGIVFLGRAKMRALNRRFLDHDRDTDVLAFGYGEDPGPGRGSRPFGDILICAPQARVQAADCGHPVLTEVLILAAHGMLHLLGYGDATPAGQERMRRRQDRAVRGASRPGI